MSTVKKTKNPPQNSSPWYQSIIYGKLCLLTLLLLNLPVTAEKEDSRHQRCISASKGIPLQTYCRLGSPAEPALCAQLPSTVLQALQWGAATDIHGHHLAQPNAHHNMVNRRQALVSQPDTWFVGLGSPLIPPKIYIYFFPAFQKAFPPLLKWEKDSYSSCKLLIKPIYHHHNSQHLHGTFHP